MTKMKVSPKFYILTLEGWELYMVDEGIYIWVIEEEYEVDGDNWLMIYGAESIDEVIHKLLDALG